MDLPLRLFRELARQVNSEICLTALPVNQDLGPQGYRLAPEGAQLFLSAPARLGSRGISKYTH